MTTTLNAQQKIAYDKIVSLDFKEFLLTGEGGCGKTYVLTQAIEYIIELGGTVLIAAPTHMARQGLLNKVSAAAKVTGRVKSKTLASLLGRFAFRTGGGEVAFSSGKIPITAEYDLIVIDEVSMMAEKDLAKLKLCPVPIVYTGDMAQLPVVKQKKANWEGMEKIVLTEQVRQSGAILTLAQRCRDSIFIPGYEDAKPSEGLYVADDEAHLLDIMLEDIEAGTHELYEYRYLTYTNREVLVINQKVRQRLYPEALAPFTAGEYLLLEETTPVGYNGEVVMVDEVVDAVPNEAWGVTTYLLNIDGTHISTVSPDDRLKLDEECARIKTMISAAREAKNKDALASLTKELEFVESNWVKLNYIHATTCHKAQGMTIPNVYLNTRAIDAGSNKRALLYVGISRASEKLVCTYVPLKPHQVTAKVNALYREARLDYTTACGYPAEKHWKWRVNNPLSKGVAYRVNTLELKWLATWAMFLTASLVRLSYLSIKYDITPMFQAICSDITTDAE